MPAPQPEPVRLTPGHVARGTLRALVTALSRRAVLIASIVSSLAAGADLCWWFEWACHVQHICLYFFACAAPLLWIVRSRRWALVALIGLAYNAYYVAPLYLPPPNRIGDDQQPNLRVLTANMHGSPTWELLDLVDKTRPDIVCIQEFPMVAWYMSELKARFPYCSEFMKEEPTARWRFDTVVFSRHESEKLDAIRLQQGSYFPMARLKTRVNGRWLTLLSCHMTPVRDAMCVPVSEQEYTALAELIRNSDSPVVAAGDFNQPPWSPRLNRFRKAAGLISARRGFGVLTSYPLGADWFGTGIDDVFVTPEIQISRCWVGPDVGSDHRPVLAEFHVPARQ